MSSFSTLLCAVVALLFCIGSVSAAPNSMVFIDNTTPFTVTLPTAVPGSTNDVSGLSSNVFFYVGSGQMSFTLDWNGDLNDAVNFGASPSIFNTRGGNISISATGVNAPWCSQANLSASAVAPLGTSVALNATYFNCTYVITYKQWGGFVSLDYFNGSVSETININFKPSPLVVGDPQFIGLRGQSYQVHGIDGAVYNIISDKNLQVNGKFAFLTEGQCPMIDGVADTNCWSHPGSYIGEMSFQQVVDGKLHAALVTSGDAKTGFSMVQMDGKVVAVGQTVTFGSLSLTRVSSHAVTVQTEQFSFELSNSDYFINQAVAPRVALSKLHSHGLLGQTHSSTVYANALRHIEGDVDDYVIADNDIFGDDFLFNKFQQ